MSAETEFLIVGQGLAGTLLSHALREAGRTFKVCTSAPAAPSSMASSAFINPLAGRNFMPAPQMDEAIAVAKDTYASLGEILGMQLLHQKALLHFLKTQEAEAAVAVAREKDMRFLPSLSEADLEAAAFFTNDHLSVAKVAPCFSVNAGVLLQRWRKLLQDENALVLCSESAGDLHFAAGGNVVCNGIDAEKIIFCEGASGAANMFFPMEKFTQNFGEFLLLHIPGLPENYAFQNELRLVPRGDGVWWCGTNYAWTPKEIDTAWRAQTTETLQRLLTVPFTVIDHQIAARPTTAGQKPILARHSARANVFMFNGLGTRGFSFGPMWARVMANFVLS